MAAQPDTTASPLDRHAAPVTDHNTPAGRKDGRATAALIVGIIGILIALLIPLVGLVLGIVATVLGAVSKRDIAARGYVNAGTARAGMILGIIAIVVAVASWIIAAAILAS
jgi:hypothetical protein